MTQTKRRIATATKNGKQYTAMVAHGERGLFEFDSLLDAGMIRVVACGQENIYFEWTCDEGYCQAGYCKSL